MKRALVIVLFLAACGGGGDDDSNVYVPSRDAPNANTCSPSDEAYTDLVDRLSRNDVMVDDTQAFALTAPTEGQTVPRGTPFTFAWAKGSTKTPRHLCGNGEFVLLHFEGTTTSFDVMGGCLVSLGCDPFPSWTPDAETWKRFTDAGGDIHVTITTATYDRYHLASGPYQPTAATVTFTVAAP